MNSANAAGESSTTVIPTGASLPVRPAHSAVSATTNAVSAPNSLTALDTQGRGSFGADLARRPTLEDSQDAGDA